MIWDTWRYLHSFPTNSISLVSFLKLPAHYFLSMIYHCVRFISSNTHDWYAEVLDSFNRSKKFYLNNCENVLGWLVQAYKSSRFRFRRNIWRRWLNLGRVLRRCEWIISKNPCRIIFLLREMRKWTKARKHKTPRSVFVSHIASYFLFGYLGQYMFFLISAKLCKSNKYHAEIAFRRAFYGWGG